jgi:hypothetical protein
MRICSMKRADTGKRCTNLAQGLICDECAAELEVTCQTVYLEKLFAGEVPTRRLPVAAARPSQTQEP